MRNSFTYKCAQLWNKLPEDVKLADDVNVFKSKLRSIIFLNFLFLCRCVIFITPYIRVYIDYRLRI